MAFEVDYCTVVAGPGGEDVAERGQQHVVDLGSVLAGTSRSSAFRVIGVEPGRTSRTAVFGPLPSVGMSGCLRYRAPVVGLVSKLCSAPSPIDQSRRMWSSG